LLRSAVVVERDSQLPRLCSSWPVVAPREQNAWAVDCLKTPELLRAVVQLSGDGFFAMHTLEFSERGSGVFG
jgi:hypothetical protein